nr:uncharacterized protein LOC115116205 [Oncorhynchus nerka]
MMLSCSDGIHHESPEERWCVFVFLQHYDTKCPMGCPDFAIDDDEEDTANKISSEDSGEVASYTEDSDESYSLELDTDSSHTGQMTLLEEILDSLSTTSTEHGKLSAAKSLDFSSMDNINYKATNTSNPVSESNLPQVCTSGSGVVGRGGVGGGEQGGGWQDDGALHGKHLPPSPRRQLSKSSLKRQKHILSTSSPPVLAPASEQDNQVPNLQPKTQAPQTKAQHKIQPNPQALYDTPAICLSQLCPESSLPTPPAPSLGDHHISSNRSPAPSLGDHHISSNRSPAPTRASTCNRPLATDTPPLTHTRESPNPQLLSPESEPQTTSSILRRKVLSKETMRQYQDKSLRRQGSKNRESLGVKARQPSVLVPWERESPEEMGQGEELEQEQGRVSGAEVQEKGLLEEIDSMCHLGPDFQTSLQLSQVHCKNNNTHDNTHYNNHSHSKATDKS